MTYTRLDDLTKERLNDLIEKRLYTDGEIARFLGIKQPQVSYYRQKLGYPPVCHLEAPTAIIKRKPATPIAKYFDDALRAWVSVYQAMFADGYIGTKSVYGFTGLYDAGGRKSTRIGTNSRRNA